MTRFFQTHTWWSLASFPDFITQLYMGKSFLHSCEIKPAWEWPSPVPRPSHTPVSDRLQYAKYCKRSKTGVWEGLGIRLGVAWPPGNEAHCKKRWVVLTHCTQWRSQVIGIGRAPGQYQCTLAHISHALVCASLEIA